MTAKLPRKPVLLSHYYFRFSWLMEAGSPSSVMKDVMDKLLKCFEKGEKEESLSVQLLLGEKKRLEHIEEEKKRKEKELEEEKKRKEEVVDEILRSIRALFSEGKNDTNLVKSLTEEKDRLLEEKKDLDRQLVLLWSSRLGVGGAGTSVAGTDTPVSQPFPVEDSYMKKLLQPLPSPPSPEELKEVINSKLAAPLSIPRHCIFILQGDGLLEALKQNMTFVVSSNAAAEVEFAGVVSRAIVFERNLISESDVRSALDLFVTDLFLTLNRHAPRPVTMDYNSNVKDFSGATEGSMRPDFLLWVGTQKALLFKGEDKSAGHTLQDAVNDLKRKVKDWSSVNYGSIKYMLCYAAAGSKLELGALAKNGTYMSLICLDLNRLRDRLMLILNVINIYRVLASLEPCLPNRMISLGLVIERERGGRVTICDGFVEKKLPLPGPLLASSETLQKVYKLTAGCPYLVELTAWIVPNKRARGCETGQVTLRLSPLGYDCEAHEEEGLREAVRCILQALRRLHDEGFVHRDVRWPNVLQKADGSWFLIDLEMCAEGEMQEGSWTWPAVEEGINCLVWGNRACLDNGRFTPASDLWMVAVHLMATDVLGFQGQDFRDKLKSFHYRDSRTALEHPWFALEIVK
eukprot:TRINITY_DN22315_c0_g1_i1.p1 TRINITY_DN22315_c0_g1~~TRINITY_DN22315_c0_g1_i1.p1  ORF type:complete len:631 (-),score=140.08 TRINITY_DN22315_c0_g1_i1:237-2129(-)